MSDFTCPSEIRCFYPRGLTRPYSILFYHQIGNRKSIQNGQDRGSPRAVSKTKVQQFTDKKSTSSQKIAGGSMRNRRASGPTENTDHGGRFQPKTPTSDSFFRQKIQLAWRTCYSAILLAQAENLLARANGTAL